MASRSYWLIRFTAYALLGILALISPPHSDAQRAVQIACFSVVGAALLASLLLERFPRYRTWGLPIALGVMAVASGLAALTSGDGQTLGAFTGVAAIAAGTDVELPAAIAVAAAGILPIWIVGPLVGATFATLVGYPLLIVACLSFGRNRRSYRVQAEQAAALLEQSERARAEQRRADVLDERARIAREIHDVLAHSLGALGIQEALINAAKHAPGQQITVRLDYGEASVRLCVVNHLDGTGAAVRKPGSTGGYGLTGMRERLRLLNGTLLAGPRDDQWAVTRSFRSPPRT